MNDRGRRVGLTGDVEVGALRLNKVYEEQNCGGGEGLSRGFRVLWLDRGDKEKRKGCFCLPLRGQGIDQPRSYRHLLTSSTVQTAAAG